MSLPTPVYKRFSQLRQFLESGDVHQANRCYVDLQQEDLLPRARELLSDLARRYPGLLHTETPTGSNLLSALDDSSRDREGVGIVSCCMNRNDNLRKAIESWLALPVDEIVVVDWSSTIPVSETLKDIQDDRLKIVRVENEDSWVLTYAFNVGLRFCTCSHIFKLDADIVVSNDFLDANCFGRGEYVRGHWQLAIDRGEEDQVYTNGSFGVSKSDLRSIGYFNEYIRSYGWDDSDLYSRLCVQLGLSQKHIAYQSITHIDQAEEERLKHQKVDRNMLLGRFPATELHNLKNKYISQLYDFWEPRFLQDYEIKASAENLFQARRVTEGFEIPGYVLEDALAYAVLQLLKWHFPHWIQSFVDHKVLALFCYSASKAGLSDRQIASIIGVSNEHRVAFAGHCTIDQLIARSSAEDGCSSPADLVILRGEGEPIDICHDGQTFSLARLNDRDYERALSLRKHSTGDVDAFDSASKQGEADTKNKLILVSSVFDEGQSKRMDEYVECFERNLEYFDVLVLHYERSDGSFASRAEQSLARRLAVGATPPVLYVETEQRPTFRDLFSSADSLFPGATVCVANADIAFDGTLRRHTREMGEDRFFVLSRKEAEKVGRGKGLISNQFGLPNTFSADAWVYRAPLRHEFRCDFEIGSFHCDSLLNYHIGRSGYRLYNPCLSVNCFHIHDPAFNSSAQKEATQSAVIGARLEQETALAGGELPLRGVQWSTISHTGNDKRANSLVHQSDLLISIDLGHDMARLVLAVIQAVMCTRINSKLGWGGVVWLNMSVEAASSGVGDIVYEICDALSCESLCVGAISEGEVFEGKLDGYEKSMVSHEELLESYKAANLGTDGHIYASSFRPGETSVTPRLLCSLQKDASDIDVYCLLSALTEIDLEALRSALAACLAAGYKEILPFLHDLDAVGVGRADFEGYDSFKNVPQNDGFSPKLAFVTSVFKGDEFFRGYLENISAAAIECDAEIVMVSGASPGNEKEILSGFLAEFPGMSARIRYIELEQDPGLYACWRTAIENCSAPLISNANLDDRRSPFQARELVAALESGEEYAAAATAIRATRARNTDWFECTGNDYWFNEGFGQDIKFDSLYVKDANGLVKSQNILHCMPIWRKSLHDSYGYFEEDRYGTSADWAFWLKCAQAGEKYRLVPLVLSQYYVNESSHNRVHDAEGTKELLIISDFIGVEQEEFVQQ